ncbi:Pycsar system effector family protein [Owenweeksia hongkongensis]|uniref:Pycsar system effector family protein n=1 Tax=Owenweeksia hongkongensis TaxID=253245 RepID=UPI003A9093EC
MDNISTSQLSTTVLTKVQLHSMECIIENATRVVYHDVRFAKRLIAHINTITADEEIGEDDLQILSICAWLYTTLFGNIRTGSKNKNQLFDESSLYIDEHYPKLLDSFGMDKIDSVKIINLVKAAIKTEAPHNRLSGIFTDAVVMDLTGDQAMDRLKKLYEEAVLGDVNLSLSKFYDLMIGYLSPYNANTEYGKTHTQPAALELIHKLEREKRKLSQKKNIILKKQLEISEDELKELRKNLVGVKGRDVRGIQTLFRTTSRNHYTLNQMVDRKASIMITVNAIILSVVIGGLLRSTGDSLLGIMPMAILSIASLFSIIFAILSITPNRTQGEFTVDDIRNKKGNLLYFGNFHNMEFRDYEWGMLQKLSDSNFLYSSMIRDLYYLGKTLQKKYTLIRISLQFFVIGLVSSFVLFMISRLVVFY